METDAKPKKPRTTKGKIKAMLAAKQRGRKEYAAAGELEREVMQKMEPGEEIDIGNGMIATLVDKFEGKDRIMQPCYVGRFELQVKPV